MKKLTGRAPILGLNNTGKSVGAGKGSVLPVSAETAVEYLAIADSINATADFDFGNNPFDKELKKQHNRWFNLLRTRFPWKAKHGERVGKLAKEFAVHLGASERATDNIEYAAKLHDIGNIWTPGVILNKPSELTDEEYKTMQRHSNDGASILVDMELLAAKKLSKNNSKKTKSLSLRQPIDDKKPHDRLGENCSDMTRLAVSISLNHHGDKHSNGGKGISDEAVEGYDATTVFQLVAICDYYDAMQNPRPYKKGNSSCNVLEVMEKHLSNGELAEQGDARAYLAPDLFAKFVPFIKERNMSRGEEDRTPVFGKSLAGVVLASQLFFGESGKKASTRFPSDKNHNY